ncbi:hypothetical protein ACLK2B_09100 [Escherichia coli]
MTAKLDFDVRAVTEVGQPCPTLAHQDHDERRQSGLGCLISPNCPNAGVGLARLEFIINRMIGVHPKALLEFDQQSPELQATIARMIPQATTTRGNMMSLS